jgi:hypothetical protein
MDDDAPPWRRKTAATLKPQATTMPVRHVPPPEVPPPEQKAKHVPPPAQKAKQPQAPQAPLSSDKYREVRLFFQRQIAEAEKEQKLLDTERARLEKGEIFPADMEAAWSQPAWELWQAEDEAQLARDEAQMAWDEADMEAAWSQPSGSSPYIVPPVYRVKQMPRVGDGPRTSEAEDGKDKAEDDKRVQQEWQDWQRTSPARGPRTSEAEEDKARTRTAAESSKSGIGSLTVPIKLSGDGASMELSGEAVDFMMKKFTDSLDFRKHIFAKVEAIVRHDEGLLRFIKVGIAKQMKADGRMGLYIEGKLCSFVQERLPDTLSHEVKDHIAWALTEYLVQDSQFKGLVAECCNQDVMRELVEDVLIGLGKEYGIFAADSPEKDQEREDGPTKEVAAEHDSYKESDEFEMAKGGGKAKKQKTEHSLKGRWSDRRQRAKAPPLDGS